MMFIFSVDISRSINWPSSNSSLKSPIQQQILEICVCCYYIDNDYIPTEILQLIVKKIIVLAHKINFCILNEEHSVKRKREKVDENQPKQKKRKKNQ